MVTFINSTLIGSSGELSYPVLSHFVFKYKKKCGRYQVPYESSALYLVSDPLIQINFFFFHGLNLRVDTFIVCTRLNVYVFQDCLKDFILRDDIDIILINQVEKLFKLYLPRQTNDNKRGRNTIINKVKKLKLKRQKNYN